MSGDPIQSAMHAALGPLFARMSRSQEVTFVVDGQRYDVACAAGDTARVIEASPCVVGTEGMVMAVSEAAYAELGPEWVKANVR